MNEQSFNITHKTGGVFGIGKSESRTEIIFEKKEYFAGDECKVKIVCDNSKCSKAIKSFKFKLERNFGGKAGHG